MPMFAVSYSRKLGHVAFNRSWTDVDLSITLFTKAIETPTNQEKRWTLDRTSAMLRHGREQYWPHIAHILKTKRN